MDLPDFPFDSVRADEGSVQRLSRLSEERRQIVEKTIARRVVGRCDGVCLKWWLSRTAR